MIDAMKGITGSWRVLEHLAVLACTLTVTLAYCNSSEVCSHGGTCVEVLNNPVCLCPPGFSGPDCSDEDFCHAQPCGAHGKCQEDDSTGTHSCVCEPQHLGLHCELGTTQQCQQHQESFCICEVNGEPIKIPLRSPPPREPGLQTRDILLGLTGLLLGWIMSSGFLALYNCCFGAQESARVGAAYYRCKQIYVRSASSASTRSSMISLRSDSTGFRPDSARSNISLISEPREESTGAPASEPRGGCSSAPASEPREESTTGPVNVYRAGFNDSLAHQTAERKSATTYSSGQKDWSLA